MPLFEQNNLGSGFQRYFQIVPAVNDALRGDVFRIRHQVYCEDLKFEAPRPDCRESDEFDSHSIHCLIRTVAAPSQWAGCTRLVLADPADPAEPLPFERTCAATLNRALVDPAKLPRERIAEVSRLAVCARFRRRKGEDRSSLGIATEDFCAHGLPRFPYIPIGLYLGAVAMAARSGIDILFVLTEPRLAAHFGKLGVDIRQIGAPLEHRGIRVPSVMDVREIIESMRSSLRPLWHVIQSEVDRGYGSEAESPG